MTFFYSIGIIIVTLYYNITGVDLTYECWIDASKIDTIPGSLVIFLYYIIPEILISIFSIITIIKVVNTLKIENKKSRLNIYFAKSIIYLPITILFS